MALSISTAHHAARLGATLAFLNAGAGQALLKIFGGARPADADAPAPTAPLASIPLASPAGSISAGALHLLSAGDGLVMSTGTAVWARLHSADGSVAVDFDCGDAASSADIKLAGAMLFAGGSVRLVSATLT